MALTIRRNGYKCVMTSVVHARCDASYDPPYDPT